MNSGASIEMPPTATGARHHPAASVPGARPAGYSLSPELAPLVSQAFQALPRRVQLSTLVENENSRSMPSKYRRPRRPFPI